MISSKYLSKTDPVSTSLFNSIFSLFKPEISVFAKIFSYNLYTIYTNIETANVKDASVIIVWFQFEKYLSIIFGKFPSRGFIIKNIDMANNNISKNIFAIPLIVFFFCIFFILLNFECGILLEFIV